MVMAKPIQFTMVKEVPLYWGGQVWATKVENKGESATTTIAQKIKYIIKIVVLPNIKKGDSKQQTPDKYSAAFATNSAPYC